MKYENVINWFKGLSKKNKLIFYRQYTHYGAYCTTSRLKVECIESILYRFKCEKSPDDYILISSKFNNKNYKFFDLDSEENLELFKKLYSNKSYVIFCSSTNNNKKNYWAFLDEPNKNIKDIFLDTIWLTCNDNKYVSFAKKQNILLIRGIYKNKSNKPILYETYGDLSRNFKLFIDTLEKYYKTEGLELSILRFKDPDMLLQFNRKQKLKNINDEI